MDDQPTQQVWISAEDAATYLIPVGVKLPIGTLTLIALNGEEQNVDEKAALAYRVETEEAEKQITRQAEDAFEPAKKIILETAEKWRMSGESEAADLFTAILNNTTTDTLSEAEWDELRSHIQSGEMQATFEELSKEMSAVVETLKKSKASTLEEVLPELMKLARTQPAQPQDWKKMEDRIKASIDKKLNEGFLKDGFPEDYSQP